MTRPSLLKRSLAEGLAAFALVFAGCGAIVTDERYHGAIAGGMAYQLVRGERPAATAAEL